MGIPNPRIVITIPIGRKPKGPIGDISLITNSVNFIKYQKLLKMDQNEKKNVRFKGETVI
jgi:hypothetical protein